MLATLRIARNLMKLKKSVTLSEVMVGTLLALTVFTGILITFVEARRHVRRANRRINALRIADSQLTALANDVDFTTWAGGNLTAGNHPLTVPWDFPENIGSTYQVNNILGGRCREVTVTINYPGD